MITACLALATRTKGALLRLSGSGSSGGRGIPLTQLSSSRASSRRPQAGTEGLGSYNMDTGHRVPWATRHASRRILARPVQEKQAWVSNAYHEWDDGPRTLGGAAAAEDPYFQLPSWKPAMGWATEAPQVMVREGVVA